MTEKKNNRIYVRVADCRDKHTKVEMALFGLDGRGGIVKDIGDIKGFMEQYGKLHNEERKDRKEGHKALTALCYSIIGGAVVAGINYMFLLFNP